MVRRFERAALKKPAAQSKEIDGCQDFVEADVRFVEDFVGLSVVVAWVVVVVVAAVLLGSATGCEVPKTIL